MLCHNSFLKSESLTQAPIRVKMYLTPRLFIISLSPLKQCRFIHSTRVDFLKDLVHVI